MIINKKNISLKHFFHGIVAILHIPLLPIIYIVKPFVEIRFGYFSANKIGHFALDLGYAIEINNQNKKNNKINLYYLQGNISNKQLGTIAKRELSVSQHYKYFVYAYSLIGLKNNIILPHRHINHSRDTTGLMYYSKYEICLLSTENEKAKSYMKDNGWQDGEKFVCLNVRDKAFYGDSELSRHEYRNSNIEDYEDAVNYLLELGYWVVRMGQEVDKPLKIKHKNLIHYGGSADVSDLLDIWLCKNCEFFISTGTGVDSVAMMFKKKIVFVNFVPIINIVGRLNTITIPKRMFWESGKELSLKDHLDNRYQSTNQYLESKINIVDSSPEEIRSAVHEMVMRIDKIQPSSEEVQNKENFWHILESHELYSKLHGVRNPAASLSSSFISRNPNFLS